MDVLALFLSRLVPLLLLFSACLLLGRFAFDHLRGRSELVARSIFAGCILLGPALAIPYVARLGYRLAAERAYSNRRWEDADRLYQRYRELHGRETEVIRFHWGVSLMNLRQWPAAEEVLLGTARPDPAPGEIPRPLRTSVGICLYYEGRSDRAEKVLEAAADPGQIYLSAYFLGRLAERRGDFGQAIEWYEAGLGRSPHFYPAVYQTVRLRLLRHESVEARKVLTRFLAGPDSAGQEPLARSLVEAAAGRGPIPAEREFLLVQH